MAATLKYLSGSLMLENDKSFHVQVAGRIRTRLKNQHGYLAYKLTTLGRASDEDIPSFLLITEELGIFLIDIVEQRVVDSIELDGTILWRDESMRATTGRDLVLDIYSDEVQSRLKNDLALYDRRTKRSKIPVESIVVFCRNTPEEAEALVSADTTEVVAVVIDQLEAWLDTIADEKPEAGVLAPVGRALSLLEGTFIYENINAPRFSNSRLLRSTITSSGRFKPPFSKTMLNDLRRCNFRLVRSGYAGLLGPEKP